MTEKFKSYRSELVNVYKNLISLNDAKQKIKVIKEKYDKI